MPDKPDHWEAMTTAGELDGVDGRGGFGCVACGAYYSKLKECPKHGPRVKALTEERDKYIALFEEAKGHAERLRSVTGGLLRLTRFSWD